MKKVLLFLVATSLLGCRSITDSELAKGMAQKSNTVNISGMFGMAEIQPLETNPVNLKMGAGELEMTTTQVGIDSNYKVPEYGFLVIEEAEGNWWSSGQKTRKIKIVFSGEHSAKTFGQFLDSEKGSK